jgi:hypothetical protein
MYCSSFPYLIDMYCSSSPYLINMCASREVCVSVCVRARFVSQVGVREQSLSADCDQSEEEIDRLVASINLRFGAAPGGTSDSV